MARWQVLASGAAAMIGGGIRGLTAERWLRFCTALVCVSGVCAVLFYEFATHIGSYNIVAGLYLLLLLLVIPVAVICRVRNPLIVVLAELTNLLFGMLLGVGVHLSLQAASLAVAYLCIRLPMYPQAICDLLMLGTMVTIYKQPAHVRILLPVMMTSFALVGVISAVRAIAQERRASAAMLDEAQRRVDALEVENQRAMQRSHMANELHDSVGHSLTAIIALAQGGADWMRNKPGQAQEAASSFDDIADIAKDSLNSTRRLLSMFNELERESNHDDDGRPAPVGAAGAEAGVRLRDWTDIQPVLSHARASGIVAVLTETGKRSDDPRCADLCFAITREAVTNAMRHGAGVSRIAVAWNHDDAGGTAIIVRDNGQAAAGATGADDAAGAAVDEGIANSGAADVADGQVQRTPGSGLRRLQERVHGVGGTLSFGPGDRGWVLAASVPCPYSWRRTPVSDERR